MKNKITAGLLALFFGGIGIHKFYLNRPFQGVIYLLFCWTFIPSVISFIEGIMYLCMNDSSFNNKYNFEIINGYNKVNKYNTKKSI